MPITRWRSQLRAMNIIYETTKERGATILMPTSMVDSMNPGRGVGVGGAATPGTNGVWTVVRIPEDERTSVIAAG